VAVEIMSWTTHTVVKVRDGAKINGRIGVSMIAEARVR